MTIVHTALLEATAKIAPVSESASTDAQALLAAVLSVDRAYLLAHGEQPLTPEQQAQYDAWVARCAAGEPLAYILGRRAFYDREFIVSPAVLIPRPETELLLEQALEFMQHHPQAVVADIGTGSGMLAVILAARCPQAQVYATDLSPDALDIARRNADAHHVHVTFLQGDLAVPLIEGVIKVDLLMANLPYIPSGELARLAVSFYEPRLALDGGADGLDLLRQLVVQIPAVCNGTALVLLEIGADQGAAVTKLLRTALAPLTVAVLQDYAGLDRVVRAELR
jgi:release factor glutamine methyltransferase